MRGVWRRALGLVSLLVALAAEEGFDEVDGEGLVGGVESANEGGGFFGEAFFAFVSGGGLEEDGEVGA